jgi:hypothetical protein
MKLRKLALAPIAVAVMALAVVVPARAASDTSFLDIISKTTIGSGTLGTVTLTQNGADEVDVVVKLAANTSFVDTGLTKNHNAFVFNLNPYTLNHLHHSYTVVITSPLNTFVNASSPIGNTPYGTFSNGIDCSGCGSGASHANPGPLKFNVRDTTYGIALSDFVANSTINSLEHYFFSADVIGPSGGTGNIASDEVVTSPVPEPETYAMMLAGLGLMGFIARRRKERDAV